jgi:NAD(P)-dependent dehydrogenase (short-subunit alcohol dehydrogenase family)
VSLFDHPYKALVFGSSGAIGQSFVNAFEHDPLCEHVQAICRANQPLFDLDRVDNFAELAQLVQPQGPFHIILDATGALTLNGLGPEKSLSALKQDQLAQAFHVNALAPVMLLRYFAPLLAAGDSMYAKLSARVGSISDNKKGGWYGYRASKAALNMFLQTAAIELQRKNPAMRVLALQPGTVRSGLSKPFAGSVEHLLEPQESVAGMLSAIKKAPPKQGALFIDYNGQEIGW